MKKWLLKEAVRIAVAKLPLHPEGQFLHYSFVVQDNKIVEWATNNNEPPPIHYGYNQLGDEFYKPKTHSEISAYRKARGIMEKPVFEMINVRLNKNGDLRLSKPCRCCSELLTELGCVRFYYSSEDGFLAHIEEES